MSLLSLIFNRSNRLPRDKSTRVSGAAKKANKGTTAKLKKQVAAISGLSGLADIAKSKRVPRGFYGQVDEMLTTFDEYVATAEKKMGLEGVPVAGKGKGCAACYEPPTGVFGVESLNIYRKARTWGDFQKVAQELSDAAEKLFEDIQSGHKGDPEKIKMTSSAVMAGRQTFTKRKIACPFLDKSKQSCRIWNERPMVCRMHHVKDAASVDPSHAGYPKSAQVVNIRLPVSQQLELGRIDKRMELQASPFLYAGVLQHLQLANGELIQEVGEAPRRMQQDGRVSQRANRNVKHAAKNKKRKK